MSKANEREVESAIDWRGHEYAVGDTVIYPRMSGRSCEIQEGVVEKIVEYDSPRSRAVQDATGTVIRDENDRVTYERVIEVGRKVRIRPTRNSRRFYRWDEKAVWIQIASNVTAANA